MAERINLEGLHKRAMRFNTLVTTSGRHVQVQGRNGYIALDEYRGNTCIRMLTAGTKREVAEYLGAMIIGAEWRAI